FKWEVAVLAFATVKHSRRQLSLTWLQMPADYCGDWEIRASGGLGGMRTGCACCTAQRDPLRQSFQQLNLRGFETSSCSDNCVRKSLSVRCSWFCLRL